MNSTKESPPISTYEHAVDFYRHKISELQERADVLPENSLWDATDILEQIESAELKLKQTYRRNVLGLLK